MEEIEIVTLEDGEEYYEVVRINNENTCYIYLANKNNPKEIVIRKNVIINGEEYIEGLKDQEELKLAINLYQSQNK